MADPLLTAAYEYASRGWVVVPVCRRDHCERGGKVPFDPADNRHLDQLPKKTADIATLKVWFTHPRVGGIAVATGHRVVALDIDLPELQGVLKGTELGIRYRTRSGYWRVLFEAPPWEMKSTNVADIEVYGRGKIVVLPPTEGYSWEDPLPEELPPWPFGRLFELGRRGLEIWNKTVNMPSDDSQSGYDLALAILALRQGLELYDARSLLLLFRNVWQAKAVGDGYYDKTLATAQQALESQGLAGEAEGRTKRRGRPPKETGSVDWYETAQRFISSQTEKGEPWAYSALREQLVAFEGGAWRVVSDDWASHWLRQRLHGEFPQLSKRGALGDLLSCVKTAAASAFPEADRELEEGLRNVDWLNLRNGMLNLETLELREHRWDFWSQIQIPWEWPSAGEGMARAHAAMARWAELVREWVPDPVELYLRQWVGYLLVPDVSAQQMLLLWGKGANGKSAFLNAVVDLLGERNVATIGLERLAERFDVASLQFKLANVMADLNIKYLEGTGTIKALIGGDPVRAEIKGGAVFSFKPITRLVFSTNILPRTADASHGWYSRLRIVPFEREFQRTATEARRIDRVVRECLEEGGLLLWAVQGLRLLRTSGWLEPIPVEEARVEYELDTNSAKAFVRTCLDVAPEGEGVNISRAGLYMAYEEWCRQEGVRPVSARHLTRTVLDELPGVELKQGAYCHDRRGNSYGFTRLRPTEVGQDLGLPVRQSRS